MIVATIAGKQVVRAQVLAWEDHRARMVMRKLAIPDSDSMTLPERRAALLARKLELGHARLRRHLRFQLFASHLLAIVLALLSGRRRSFSVCELWIERGSAEHFRRWFENRVPLDDQPGMLAGCPDHYIIATTSPSHQEVIETVGGAPFASEVVLDYSDQTGVVTPPDPAYPLQIAATAKLRSGRAVGGVRHQLRQEGEGFRALIAVEFPRAIFPSIVAGHRWHLATEFSNWIEAAAEA